MIKKKLLLLFFLFFFGESSFLLRGVTPELFKTEKGPGENFSRLTTEERAAAERRLTDLEEDESSSILEEDETSNQPELDKTDLTSNLNDCSQEELETAQEAEAYWNTQQSEIVPNKKITASWKKSLKRAIFLNLIFFGKRTHAEQFMPVKCLQATALHDEASSISQNTTEACFEIMKAYSENENMGLHHESKELSWEKLFHSSTAAKKTWMQTEKECQQDLEEVSAVEKKQNWWQLAWNLSASRLEDWTDPARWHCSPLEHPHRVNLRYYPFSCVVDSLEVDGPDPGQKTQTKIVKDDSEYFPYILIENVITTSIKKLISQRDMVAGHILIELKKGENPETVRKKLIHLDPNLSLEKTLPYEDNYDYDLYFKPNSTKLFSKLLEESRRLPEIESSHPNGLAHQHPWDRGYPELFEKDEYIPHCTLHTEDYDVMQRSMQLVRTSCGAASALEHQYNARSNSCFDILDAYAAKQEMDPSHEELELRWEKNLEIKQSLRNSWIKAEEACQQALEDTRSSEAETDWWELHSRSSQSRREGLNNQRGWWEDRPPELWHCSPLAHALEKDLFYYPHACVIDSAKFEGPTTGQRTESKLLQIHPQLSPHVDTKFPYVRIENVIDASTGRVIERREMFGDRLLVHLKEGDTSQAFLASLKGLGLYNHILGIEKMSSYYPPLFILYVHAFSLRSFSRILEMSSGLSLWTEPIIIHHPTKSEALKNAGANDVSLCTRRTTEKMPTLQESASH